MTDSDRPRRPLTGTVFVTLAGMLVIAALAALPTWVGSPAEDGLPDLAKFVGRFHPVVLHLPIGMLVWVLIQETLNLLPGKRVRSSSRTAMMFAASTAVIASLLGFVLYHSMPDYDRDLAERHLVGGIVFSCIAVAAFLVKAWTDAIGAGAGFYRILLLATCAAMGIASHDGASLTHGRGYLTDHAPDALRKILGLPARVPGKANPVADPAARVAYTDIIVPILEQKCYACHNAEKKKGKYRMDEYELLLAGGSEGDGIVPGNPAASHALVRIELPEDDDEHMPPEGKKDLEAHEVELIKWWISHGASKDAVLADLPVTDAVRDAIAKLAPPRAKELPQATSKQEDHTMAAKGGAIRAEVERINREYPSALQFESQDSGNLVFTAVGLRGKFSDADLVRLSPVLPAMVSLDLAHTKVTDSSTQLLASATSLKKLRLAETAVTDAALDAISRLPQLESLNLYGTQVTTAGILKLESLANLRKLYLWQTKVDPAGVSALRAKLPGCEIVTGL